MMRSAVWLRLYDISNGRAALWSPLVLGRRIEAVWHTGVYVFGREYFYGKGIEALPPTEVEDLYDMEIVEEQLLGYTRHSQQEFEGYLRRIDPAFSPATYNLTKWNCNHFSDACVRFLLDGVGISDGILDLPETVRSTFLGAFVMRCVELVSRNKNALASRRKSVHPPLAEPLTQQQQRQIAWPPAPLCPPRPQFQFSRAVSLDFAARGTFTGHPRPRGF